MNEASFELGNLGQRVAARTTTTSSSSSRPTTGRVDGATAGAGRAVGPGRALGLDPVGVHPARGLGRRPRLLGLHDRALRARPALLMSRGPAALTATLLDAAGRSPRERPLPPQRARVVVIGGGVIGCSVAYHLAQLGWTDVAAARAGHPVVRDDLARSGLVGQLRATEASTRLVQYSTDLYSRLEDETGLTTGYRVCGGLTAGPHSGADGRSCGARPPAPRHTTWTASCSRPHRRTNASRSSRPTTSSAPSGCPATAGPTRPTSPRRWPRARGCGGATIVERVRVTGVYDRRRGRVAGVSHRPGRRRGRVRRELRGPVGQGRRGAGRRHRAAALGRALLRRHRADRGRAPRPADPARPGRLHLRQGGGRAACSSVVSSRWPSRGCRRTRSRTRSSSRCWTRTGSTSRC